MIAILHWPQGYGEDVRCEQLSVRDEFHGFHWQRFCRV